MKKKQLTLKDYEAHIASMCVAIVSGGIGGGLAKLLLGGRVRLHSTPWEYYSLSLFIAAGYAGFLGAWLVCKYLFPSAHHWYGHGSWSHRIYDLVGIAGGVLVYWLLR